MRWALSGFLLVSILGCGGRNDGSPATGYVECFGSDGQVYLVKHEPNGGNPCD